MSSPLHTATVGVWLQILPQVARLIDKAEAHCRENGLPPEALTDARLAPDMWNFSKQVMYAVFSSAGAVRALRAGLTGPDLTDPPTDFAPLRAAVADAIALLKDVAPEEIDGAAGKDVRFEFSTNRMDYLGEDFLLSFSLPNFFFHATTAYAVLRSQGLNIGKRDFLGRVRVKTS
jgi:uncharacterized protein